MITLSKKFVKSNPKFWEHFPQTKCPSKSFMLFKTVLQKHDKTGEPIDKADLRTIVEKIFERQYAIHSGPTSALQNLAKVDLEDKRGIEEAMERAEFLRKCIKDGLEVAEEYERVSSLKPSQIDYLLSKIPSVDPTLAAKYKWAILVSSNKEWLHSVLDPIPPKEIGDMFRPSIADDASLSYYQPILLTALARINKAQFLTLINKNVLDDKWDIREGNSESLGTILKVIDEQNVKEAEKFVQAIVDYDFSDLDTILEEEIRNIDSCQTPAEIASEKEELETEFATLENEYSTLQRQAKKVLKKFKAHKA